MKVCTVYRCIRFSVFFWLCLIYSSFASQAAQSSEFVVCIEDQDMPPYIVSGTDKSHENAGGILPPLVGEVLHQVNLTVKFVRYPWKRCLLLLQQNKVDGLFASTYQKEREAIGRYPKKNDVEDKSRHLLRATYSLFTSVDKPVAWDGISFSWNRMPTIAAPLGYVVVGLLKDKHNIIAEIRLPPAVAMTAVSKSQLDGYIIEKNIGEAIVRQQGLEGRVIPLPLPFVTQYLHFMISHEFYEQQPHVAEAIWDQIKSRRLKYISDHEED